MNPFRHFQPEARRALLRAEELGRDAGAREVGTEHLRRALEEAPPSPPGTGPVPWPEQASVVHSAALCQCLDEAVRDATPGPIRTRHLIRALQALGLILLLLPGALAAEVPDRSPSLQERLGKLRRRTLRPLETPDQPRLLTLARSRLDSGDLPGALESARRAYEKAADDPDARSQAALVLSLCYQQQQEWDLAERALDEALEHLPEAAPRGPVLYQRARLRSRGLPSPEQLLEVVDTFLTQDPLTLDEDAMVYLMGFSRGLRLQRASEALESLRQVWEEGGGRPVDRALLHAALIQGFALDQTEPARALLDRLDAEHPNSSLLGLGALARAFLHLRRKEIPEALEAVSDITPEDARSREGALLGAMLAGYYLGDGERALYSLDVLERSPGRYRELSRYHRALITLVRLQDYLGAEAALEGIESTSRLPQSWITTLRASLIRIRKGKTPLERDLRFARYFERNGHYPRARYEYRRLLERDPDGPVGSRARLRLAALEQDDRGRFGPEVPDLERVVTRGHLGPALQAEARWRLARARLELGVEPSRIFREEEAGADAFSDAALQGLLLNSDSTDPERLRILHELAEDMDSADTARPRVLGTLAQGLRDRGAWEQALRVYQELLPDSPEAAREIHGLMHRMRIEALAPEGEDPLQPSRRLRLALYNLRLGQVEEAEALLEGARKEPREEARDSARAAAYLARLLSRRRARPERIREVLEDALSRAELPERDRFVLQELAARRDQEDAPEETHRQLARLVRQGFAVRRLLPELIQQTREERGPVAALGEFRLLAGDIEPDARLTALVAELYQETDQPRRARDARTRLVERWPESPEARRARVALADEVGREVREVLESPLAPERKLEALEAFLDEVPPDFRGPHRLLLDQFAREAGKDLAPALHLRLGQLHLEGFQNPRGAVPHLLRAGEGLRGPDQDRALLALARAQEAAGDLRGAYGTYARASASEAIRARALHAQARLHQDAFQEPDRAFEKELEALQAGPDEDLLLEVSQGLVRNAPVQEGSSQELARVLRTALRHLAGSEAEGEVRRLRAKALEEGGRTREAGREWIQAGNLLAPREEGVASTLKGLRLLLAEGLLQEVQREATGFLSRHARAEGAEEVRSLLRKASARTQVKTLLGSLDWGDPESSGNRERLWRVAQLMVNPLEDYPRAATRLQEVVQLFPGSTEANQAKALLRKLPVLESSTRKAPRGPVETPGESPGAGPRPEDRLAAARFVEYRLEDRARAIESYRSLFEEDSGVTGLYAGIALLRLLTIETHDVEAAWQVVEQLRARPLPAALQGRFRGRLAALASHDEWVRLERRARATPGPAGDQILGRMVELAAASYQDGPLARAVLQRMRDRNLRFEAALRAAASLDPGAAPAPEAVGPEELLEYAIRLAPDGEARARAHLLRGKLREDTPSPSLALPDYQEAIRLGGESPAGQEAMLLRAQLLLALGRNLPEALATLNRLLEVAPESEDHQLVSRKAADLSAQLQARKLDDRAAREGPRDPPLYFHTARLLSEKYKALPEALENYRTYLRVGQRSKLLTLAHLEATAVLVRMGKPREGLLMLERLERQDYPEIDRVDTLTRRARILELELADLDGAEKLYQELGREHRGEAAQKQSKEGLERIQALREGTGEPEEALEGGVPESLRAIRKEYLEGRRKNYRGASEALRAALERTRKREEQAALALELAKVEDENLRRYAEAAEAYELYLSWSHRGKTQARVLLRTAELYSDKLRRWARAHKLYERFLASYHSHPRRVPTMVAQGKVLERLDRVQEALQIYQIVVDSFPRSGHDEVALERLAYLRRTYFAAFQGAIDAYRELIARFPFSRLADDAQYSIARIYEIELGNLTLAKTEYELLIQRYPSSEHYAKAQNGLTRIARR